MNKPVISLFLYAISYLGIALPAFAHEFWLEPQDYQPETNTTLQVELRNGQKFKGVEIGYFDKRVEMFDWIQSEVRSPVQSRAGDFPTMTMPVAQDGLMVLVYQSTNSTVQYNTWEKFAAFAKHKDFPDAVARHIERNLPMERFSEVYTRYCKSLIGVGDAAGQDATTGLETEFVALNNPYTEDLSGGFSVQLIYQGMPRINAQIEVFERNPEGTVDITYLHTDVRGQAMIPVKAGHTYLLDAVVLRDPQEDVEAELNVVWETLWASMTFSVPQ